MKPKNKKERWNSLLKFSVLFVFTTALIVLAFFFDFNRIPLKENAVLRNRSQLIENEMQFQKKFSVQMQEIQSLLDSLDIPGQNLQYTNAIINSKIVDLQKSIPKEDSTYRYAMYNNIVKSYVDIHHNKNKIKKLRAAQTQLEEYEEEVKKLHADLNRANRHLDALRR